jgi:hypothetical protein
MAQTQVVQPGIERLTLSTGDTVDVIKELNAGEYWDLLMALGDRQPFAKILAYVTGWSFVGLDGQPLPYSLDLPASTRRDTVRALNKRVVRELIATLDRHEAEVDAAFAKKKPAPATPPAAPASSPTSA